MNSIDNLKSELNSQLRYLNKIHNRKILDDCIYVGSGDSYVAGLIVEFVTDHRCRCYSPSDLSNSKFIDGKTYCFISATGRTRANIELARRARQNGAKTIAVTQDRNSQLARICKETVPIEIPTTSNLPSAGFGTFVANVKTCLQLIGVMVPSKFDKWYKNGAELSGSLLGTMILPKVTLHILGNNTLYALSLYASLKMAEFFCATAVAHKLEEFCHSPIFGIKKSHHLWIMGQHDQIVSDRLETLGIYLSYVELYNRDIFTQVFESIFFVQNLMLLLAKKYGNTQLQFLIEKKILKASSDIIYGKNV